VTIETKLGEAEQQHIHAGKNYFKKRQTNFKANHRPNDFDCSQHSAKPVDTQS
jgi:hypothetical protein